MDLPANSFKQALREGRRQFGLWQALASPYAAEICATMGFDWLLFDGEHAPNTLQTMLAQIQAIAPYPVHAVARLPAGETWIIKQYLDVGYTTLLVPLVDTAAQAEALVRAVRYAPAGVRGIGHAISRAARWNKVRGYLAGADAEICLLVQAESTMALTNLAAIAAVDGIDGVFIGPSDLAASMGLPGQLDHPDVVDAIARAVGPIRAAGKAAGMLASNEAHAHQLLELGYSFVALGSDIGLLLSAGTGLAQRFKQRLPSAGA